MGLLNFSSQKTDSAMLFSCIFYTALTQQTYLSELILQLSFHMGKVFVHGYALGQIQQEIQKHQTTEVWVCKLQSMHPQE